MAHHRPAVAATLAVVFCLVPLSEHALEARVVQVRALDRILNAYLGNDGGIVSRTFVRSRDFQEHLRLNNPRDLDRWLGSWNPGKALLLLELARVSSRVAPQYASVIAAAGRRYLASIGGAPGPTDAFVRVWHRTVVAVLLGSSDPARVDEHLAELGGGRAGPDVSSDPRLRLSRAVAQERRCWTARPSLDQPEVRVDALLAMAGFAIPEDSVGPSRAEREALLARHGRCLREALARFETAAAGGEAAAEARVRGGWILFQDGRAAEAIQWLGAAAPHDDRALHYWHNLFRGRALESLGRIQDAADAYRAALTLYPGAQSAGLGLTLALMHLDRTTEADDVARSVRESGVMTPDPWAEYPEGDGRFVEGWIERLRGAVR